VTKIAVTPFDPPYSRKSFDILALYKSDYYYYYYYYSKTPCCTQNTRLTGVIADRSFTLGSSRFFCFCDLDPMTLNIYELDPHPIKMYTQTKKELYTSGLSKVIVLQTNAVETIHMHAAWGAVITCS